MVVILFMCSCEKFSCGVLYFIDVVFVVMCVYSWLGNVWELENVIEWVVIFIEEDGIGLV